MGVTVLLASSELMWVVLTMPKVMVSTFRGPLRTVASDPLADDQTEGPVSDAVMARYHELAGRSA